MIGRGDEDSRFVFGEVLELIEKRGDGTVEALRGARGEFDFGE